MLQSKESLLHLYWAPNKSAPFFSTRCFLLSCFGCVGLLFCLAAAAQKKIVVLGSSTAAGVGASSSANAWVTKYTAYVQTLNPNNTVVNLAVSGFTTASVMPTGTGGEDPQRNITKALTYNPNVIVVNLPTNDAANGVSLAVTMSNFRQLRQVALNAGVAFFISTTQPRNLGASGQTLLMDTRDSIYAQFGAYAINFWTTVANADGSINPKYSAADGIHLNDDGHEVLFQSVKTKTNLNAILPVSLVKFSAQTVGPEVQLNWEISASDEKPVQEIERSEDGRTFTKIGTVNASSAAVYSFTDRWPATGINYYRLKFLTASSVKYGAVLKVETTNGGPAALTVFPNPVVGREMSVRIRLQRAGNGLLMVTDAHAKEVLRQQVAAPAGASWYALPLPATLPGGLYFVRFVGPEKTNFQQAVLLP